VALEVGFEVGSSDGDLIERHRAIANLVGGMHSFGQSSGHEIFGRLSLGGELGRPPPRSTFGPSSDGCRTRYSRAGSILTPSIRSSAIVRQVDAGGEGEGCAGSRAAPCR
jgi:hypothetical protein